MATVEMREQILDSAQGLVQTRGYDGFSFADVANRVGIRKASIHHHFPTKEDLGVRLIERFRRDCRARLGAIGDDFEPTARLFAYLAMFRETLDSGRMCLCGILAAGFSNLPATLKAEVAAALAEQQTWLVSVIGQGRTLGLFRTDRPVEAQARALLGGLEGAMLLARLHDDHDSFDIIARSMVEDLAATHPRKFEASPTRQ